MLLGPHEHGWLLGTHDMLVSWNMASFGRLDEAEAAALSSIERFDAAGEVLLVVNALNALAGIAAAKGDFEGASAAYEALLERCRATGQHPYLPFCLVSLAGVRARQGDAAAADHLYQEAIGCCYNPWLSADAMVGQAAVARHLGDLSRCERSARHRRGALPGRRPSRRPSPGACGTGLVGDRRRSTRRCSHLRGRCRQSRKGNRGSRIPTARRFRPGRSQRDRRPHSAQHRRLRRVGPTASLRSLASLPHRRAGSGGPRDSAHAYRDLNRQSRSSSSSAGRLKPWPLAPQHHLRAASGHKRNLIVMHRNPERPNTRHGQSASAGPAVEDHGRVVTANIQAAAFYRQAQQAADASAP